MNGPEQQAGNETACGLHLIAMLAQKKRNQGAWGVWNSSCGPVLGEYRPPPVNLQ